VLTITLVKEDHLVPQSNMPYVHICYLQEYQEKSTINICRYCYFNKWLCTLAPHSRCQGTSQKTVWIF